MNGPTSVPKNVIRPISRSPGKDSMTEVTLEDDPLDESIQDVHTMSMASEISGEDKSFSIFKHRPSFGLLCKHWGERWQLTLLSLFSRHRLTNWRGATEDNLEWGQCWSQWLLGCQRTVCCLWAYWYGHSEWPGEGQQNGHLNWPEMDLPFHHDPPWPTLTVALISSVLPKASF